MGSYHARNEKARVKRQLSCLKSRANAGFRRAFHQCASAATDPEAQRPTDWFLPASRETSDGGREEEEEEGSSACCRVTQVDLPVTAACLLCAAPLLQEQVLFPTWHKSKCSLHYDYPYIVLFKKKIC